MNLADARDAFAAALSTVEGVSVRPRGGVKAPRPGDGWVALGGLSPSDFRRSAATMRAVVVLGQDTDHSEELLDTLAVEVLDAATRIQGLPTADVSLATEAVVLDGGGTLNVMIITATTEVSRT